MLRFVLVRIGQAVVSLFGATAIVFAFSRATGDPVSVMAPSNATVEDLERVRANLGLDQPLARQYVTFIKNALSGDFGRSIQYRRPAIDIVMDAVWPTVVLALLAFAATILIAVPSGVYAAAYRGRTFDRGVRALSAAGQALPGFLVATFLIFVFAVRLGVLPTSGMGGWKSYVLPVTTMAIFAVPGVLRLTRSATLETLSAEYVRFARVKGVSEGAVLWRHAFKNASLTVLTFGALLLLNLLSGTVVVETVFGWPGLGRTVVTAVIGSDFPVVQAIVLLMSTAYIAGSLMVDLGYAALNPRIRSSM